MSVYLMPMSRWPSNCFSRSGPSVTPECVPMCTDCGFLPYCGSDPVYHHATQGDVVGFKPTSGFCRKNMGVISQPPTNEEEFACLQLKCSVYRAAGLSVDVLFDPKAAAFRTGGRAMGRDGQQFELPLVDGSAAVAFRALDGRRSLVSLRLFICPLCAHLFYQFILFPAKVFLFQRLLSFIPGLRHRRSSPPIVR